jgi:hypothetical protein
LAQKRSGSQNNAAQNDRHAAEFQKLGKLIDNIMGLIAYHADLPRRSVPADCFRAGGLIIITRDS